jgi:lipopolysaccharide transport system permease protein
MAMQLTRQNTKIKMRRYEPNYLKKAGRCVWVDMLRELIESRGLIWRLIIRDISARYRQSVLGIFWSFLTPLLMTIIFLVLKNNKILPIGETAFPYVAYVFFGQMIWLLFSQGLTTASNSMISSSSLLAKINFPKEVLILSALGQTIFDFIMRIPLLIIIFFWVGFVPKPAIILVPVIIIPLLFLIFGLGLLVAMFNAIIRDIGSVLLIVLSVAMFASPVIYPPPTAWPLNFWINHVNPVSGFLIAAQDLAAKGYIADPAGYFSAVLFSIVILLVGWRIFHLVEPKIAERI